MTPRAAQWLIAVNLACILVAGVLSIKNLSAVWPLLKSKRSRQTQSVEDGRKARWALVRLLAFIGAFVTALVLARSQLASQQQRADAEAKRRVAEEKRQLAEKAAQETLQDVHSLTSSLAARQQEKDRAESAAREEQSRREAAEALLARRLARLQVSWAPVGGRSIDLTRVTESTALGQEEDQDRKEYAFTIANPSGYRLADASFSMEFPYPVASSELSKILAISGLAFQPINARIEGRSIGGGTLQVRPGGCTWFYAMTIGEIRPDAVLEYRLRLYTGARIPPEPQPGGLHWRYRYQVGPGWAARSRSAPFKVDTDKTVILGAEHAASWALPAILSFGFANCGAP